MNLFDPLLKDAYELVNIFTWVYHFDYLITSSLHARYYNQVKHNLHY